MMKMYGGRDDEWLELEDRETEMEDRKMTGGLGLGLVQLKRKIKWNKTH